MASGISRQMMAFRTLAHNAVFRDDQLCERCSYNLRGLRLGQRCPECAAPTPLDARPSDPLLGHPEDARRGIATGLIAIGAMLLVAIVARLAIVVFGLSGLSDPTRLTYTALLSVEALAFAGGAWLATPASYRTHYSNFNRWAHAIRLLALAWLPGAALLFLLTAGGGPNDDLIRGASMLLRGLGCASIVLLAVLYMDIARGAQLDTASDRLRWIWLTIPFTLLASIAPPTITWISAILLFLVLTLWALTLVPVARAFLDIGLTARWADKLCGVDIGRDVRIAARRAELDREARRCIRPLPPDGNVDHGS